MIDCLKLEGEGQVRERYQGIKWQLGAYFEGSEGALGSLGKFMPHAAKGWGAGLPHLLER